MIATRNSLALQKVDLGDAHALVLKACEDELRQDDVDELIIEYQLLKDYRRLSKDLRSRFLACFQEYLANNDIKYDSRVKGPWGFVG